MTTIAAIQGSTWVAMAYDSQVSEPEGRKYELPNNAGKCVRVGSFLLGVAGDFRVVNILAHSFHPPDAGKNRGVRLDKYMVTRFVPALKSCFDENFHGKDGEHGSTLIASVNGVAYEIGGNYDCLRDEKGLYAVGSGGNFALGALFALEPHNRRSLSAARQMLEEALQVAVSLDSGTSNPVTIVTQHWKG